MDAYSQPIDAGPKRSPAISGNSERGNASAIAAMSIANDSSSTGEVQMYASPARTSRQPARATPLPASGGIGGSRSVAHSTTLKANASTA